MHALVNPLNETTTLDYDSYDRVWKKTFHSGVYEQVVYDALQRLQSVDLKSSGGTVLRAQGYTYDNDSNVLTHTLAGVTTTYGYDEESQLTSESRSGYSASYSYDGNGNRLTRNVGSLAESYSYDSGDKLQNVSWIGHSKTFGYDDAGRTTWEKLDGSFVRQYSYDYESRITSLTYGSSTETYGYNGFDTRVTSTLGSTTKNFLRAGAGVTAPVLSDSTAHFTSGISESRSSVTTYSHSGLKNMDAQSSSSGSISATKVYDAFGNLESSAGNWSSRFGYAGGFGYQEEASGLKLLGHRYYDSSLGRFVTRDPAKDGRNWYAYCENEPVRGVDPTGLGGNFWKLIFRNASKNGDDVVYLVAENSEDAVRLTESLGQGRYVRYHPPESGFPGHAHSVGAPPNTHYATDTTSKIHVTTEELADQATDGGWANWRKSAELAGSVLSALLPVWLSAPQMISDTLVGVCDGPAADAGRGYHGWTYGGRGGMSEKDLFDDIYGG